MERWRGWIAGWYWTMTIAVLAVGVVLVVRAPMDETMGPIQKLIYLHLPVAVNTFLAALLVCVASVGYLAGRRQKWDDLAHAAAAVTVLNGTVLLLTGMFWGKVAWNLWWTWSPRLTFSLILWALYLAYLLLRRRIASPERRALISAVYGVVAFLDVPLLYLAVKLLPDVHPTQSGLVPSMYPVLWTWLVAITMLSGGLVSARFVLARLPSFRWEKEPSTPLVPPAAGLSG
jgi:heme exporter protein C